jgi:hypothetical protein
MEGSMRQHCIERPPHFVLCRHARRAGSMSGFPPRMAARRSGARGRSGLTEREFERLLEAAERLERAS